MPRRHDQTDAIPDKLNFKIGEASKIAGIEPHVLRFWESEFRALQPKRTSAGQRIYRRQDVALILVIKDLLHRRRFTIEGAVNHLRRYNKMKGTDYLGSLLEEIRMEIEAIRQILS